MKIEVVGMFEKIILGLVSTVAVMVVVLSLLEIASVLLS